MITLRRIVQLGFLLLTLMAVFVFRGNAEKWCPLGGVEALYTYAQEGNMPCSLGLSNFYILVAVLGMTLLVRRAFCGYMCPLGTISEWLHQPARRLGIAAIRIPEPVDRVLGWAKYIVLAAILYATWRAGELMFRGYDPCYALISRHGEDITLWAYVVAGVIGVASLLIIMPFCRWFCPFAAVLQPFSRLGLTRIQRDAQACTGCGACARACPMAIPVDRLEQVTAARCLSCFNCVEACPQQEMGTLVWGPPRRLGRRWPQAALVAIMLICTAGAAWAAYLFPIPAFVKVHGTPPVNVSTVEWKVDNLRCRGNANLLVYFLQRDDLGPPLRFFKLEAWPNPAAPADVRITYDPRETNEQALKQAITEPVFELGNDSSDGFWRMSPYRIEGYDPLGPPSVKRYPEP
jgi:ferredoxin